MGGPGGWLPNFVPRGGGYGYGPGGVGLGIMMSVAEPGAQEAAQRLLENPHGEMGCAMCHWTRTDHDS